MKKYMIKKQKKRLREDIVYSKIYPHYIEWGNRIWVLKEGDYIRNKETDEVYIVKQVLKSVRTEPKIIVELINKEE